MGARWIDQTGERLSKEGFNLRGVGVKLVWDVVGGISLLHVESTERDWNSLIKSGM